MESSARSLKNVAAWALNAKSRPLVVRDAPYALPLAGYLTIQVSAVAVNPIDWIMQDSDLFNITYPAIFGMDIAGEVAYVGDEVDGFELGQRVIAYVSPSKKSDSQTDARCLKV